MMKCWTKSKTHLIPKLATLDHRHGRPELSTVVVAILCTVAGANPTNDLPRKKKKV